MRLHRRLMLSFALFALAVSILFAFFSVVLVYTLEDEFFARLLADEEARQVEHWHRTGRWAVPREEFISIYVSPAEFPEDLRSQFDGGLRRREFFGTQGRHYHVQEIQVKGVVGPRYLVAEVSGHLVVRPVRAQIFGFLAWTGIAVVIAASLLGYWFARRAAQPLTQLAGQVAGIDPQRLPQAFPQPAGDDEVSVLTRGVAQLVERIRAFVERERLFTRDASHELRTPIAVISSAAERLSRDAEPSDVRRQQLEFIRNAAHQMEQTVSTLLSLAREETAPPLTEPTLVLPVVESVVVEYAHLLEHVAAHVQVAVSANFRSRLPAPVLRILLANLIGNAFLHARAGTIVIDEQDGALRIADSGPGLPPAQRESLYQPFNKHEASSGFGLGLAIVRRLCDRYGVGLEITSALTGQSSVRATGKGIPRETGQTSVRATGEGISRETGTTVVVRLA